MENVRITHVMADGTVRDSIEGMVIPLNEKTRLFYSTIADHLKSVARDQQATPTTNPSR